jgi:ElaB/YqjD/DUF883 family membrane-anchored ribosome-binding protein
MNPLNGANPSTLDPIDTLEANFKSVVEVLTSGASSAEDKVSDAKKTVAATVTALAAKAGKAIKDHPLAAIGVAFGVGYLLMRLIRR